jgi:hypothetical protein
MPDRRKVSGEVIEIAGRKTVLRQAYSGQRCLYERVAFVDGLLVCRCEDADLSIDALQACSRTMLRATIQKALDVSYMLKQAGKRIPEKSCG